MNANDESIASSSAGLPTDPSSSGEPSGLSHESMQPSPGDSLMNLDERKRISKWIIEEAARTLVRKGEKPTQKRIGELFDVGQDYVAKVLGESRNALSVEKINHFAKLAGLSLSTLIERASQITAGVAPQPSPSRTSQQPEQQAQLIMACLELQEMWQNSSWASRVPQTVNGTPIFDDKTQKRLARLLKQAITTFNRHGVPLRAVCLATKIGNDFGQISTFENPASPKHPSLFISRGNRVPYRLRNHLSAGLWADPVPVENTRVERMKSLHRFTVTVIDPPMAQGDPSRGSNTTWRELLGDAAVNESTRMNAVAWRVYRDDAAEATENQSRTSLLFFFPKRHAPTQVEERAMSLFTAILKEIFYRWDNCQLYKILNGICRLTVAPADRLPLTDYHPVAADTATADLVHAASSSTDQWKAPSELKAFEATIGELIDRVKTDNTLHQSLYAVETWTYCWANHCFVELSKSGFFLDEALARKTPAARIPAISAGATPESLLSVYQQARKKFHPNPDSGKTIEILRSQAPIAISFFDSMDQVFFPGWPQLNVGTSVGIPAIFQENRKGRRLYCVLYFHFVEIFQCKSVIDRIVELSTNLHNLTIRPILSSTSPDRTSTDAIDETKVATTPGGKKPDQPSSLSASENTGTPPNPIVSPSEQAVDGSGI